MRIMPILADEDEQWRGCWLRTKEHLPVDTSGFEARS